MRVELRCWRLLLLAVALLGFTLEARSRELSWAESASDYYDFEGVLIICEREGVNALGYRDGSVADSACSTPGPLLRFTPGYNYRMILVNDLGTMPTNLHTHGLHISGEGNSDNVLREATPQTCLGYNYSIPSNHAPGTFFYHAHHPRNAYTQMTYGCVGMIIIDDLDLNTGRLLALPPLPSTAPTDSAGASLHQALVDKYARIKTLLSSGLSIVAALVSSQPMFFDYSRANFSMPANTWTRVRIAVTVPAGTLQVVRLRSAWQTLDGEYEQALCDARVLAYDGIYRSSVPGPAGQFEWHVSGAGRLDLLLQCSETAQVTLFDSFFTLKVTPPFFEPYPSLDTWSPARPDYLRDLRNEAVTSSHDAMAGMMAFSWDDVDYRWPATPYPANCSQTPFRIGDVLEISMTSTDVHPIHMHVHPFQILDGNCPNHEAGEFYDTISSSSECTVRVKFTDFGGHSFLHCHNTMHADMGSRTFLYVCGGSIEAGEDDPPVEALTSCPNTQ